MADFELHITADAAKAIEASAQAAAALKKTAAAANEDGKQSEEVAKKTEFLSLKKGDLRKVVRQLSAEFPLAGQAAKAMMNPMLAGVMLGISIFSKFKQGIEALNESLSSSEWESYGKVVAAQREQMVEATLTAGAFARELDRICSAQETASQAGEKLVNVFKAQQSAQDKLDEARKRLEIAKAEAGEKDPVRKAARLMEIEERYAARKVQRDEQTRNFELQEQNRKIENEKTTAALADKQIDDARKKQASLKSEKQINEELAVEKGRLQTITQEMTQKEERYQTLKDMSWGRRSTPEQMEMNELGGQLESLTAQYWAQKRLVSRLEARAPGLIDQYRGSQENLSNLEAMKKNALERAHGMEAMLPTQTKLAQIENQSGREVNSINNQARVVEEMGKANQAKDETNTKLAEMVEKTGSLDNRLLRVVDGWAARQHELERRVANMEGQAGKRR